MTPAAMNLLITCLAPILSSFLAFILTYFLAKLARKNKENNKDNREDIDNSIKVASKVLKNSPVTVNTDKLIELMEQAEAHENFSSVEKLDYVLTNYQQYCIDSNFKYVKEVITDAVSKLIGLTKKVNMRDKDREDPDEELKVNI